MIQTLALLLSLVGQTGDKPVRILDFHSPSCGPCRSMRPAIDALVKGQYPVQTIDVSQDAAAANRYGVTAVPTQILVDRDGAELSRKVGASPAQEIANWYLAETAKIAPKAEAEPEQPRGPPASSANPKPWETVVRIRVIGSRSTGFGSGTIIASTESEAIVATCAHIFHLHDRKEAKPSEFPKKIAVDTFDGVLKGNNPAKVTHKETFSGTAIDYDFGRDVGLIRVKTNRQLPFSRVLPQGFELKPKMKMYAVGCPEGRDATTWATVIRRPRVTNFLTGRPEYEAIECDVAPKEGRSGGGLYTTDGYLAGVCDFAEPQGNHGLYASPTSIHGILDKNGLASLYSGDRSGTLIAAASNPEPRARTPEPSPTETVEADRDTRLKRFVEETCGLFHKRQGLQGAKGDPGEQGPIGPAGANGKDGRNGQDGVNGKDGKDGQDASGTPVDLTAILNRLSALEAENKLPTKVMIKTPGGKKVSHFFFPPGVDKSSSPRDGNGEYLYRAGIGIDMSDFAVPSTAPSTK